MQIRLQNIRTFMFEKITRRKNMKKRFRKLLSFAMAAAMTVTLLPATASAAPDAAGGEANDNLLRIWYDEPATDWQTEALAIGNGYMGGLVYGGVASDKIHLNEKTVWDGGPAGGEANTNNYNYGNTNPIETEEQRQEIRDNLNTIREKLEDKSQYVFGYDENSYSSAGTGTNGDAMDDLNKLMGNLTGYAAPKDYASIFINSHDVDESQVSGYIRDLDMRTALATVSYDYEGVHYTREYFNSYPDNVLVIRLTADKDGMIDFDTNLQSVFSYSASNTAEGDTITLRGSLSSNGLIAEAQLKVIPEGGEMTVDGSSINVTDADAATLILACGTDYKMELPSFRGEDPHAAVTERVNAAAEKGYDALKEDHVADHSALFSRLEIGFNEEIPQIPTDELIQKYRNMVDGNGGEIPTEAEQRALEIICYQFGRYLTIAGSREGALPTNLQGVWGEGGFTWYGDYHFNINIQMNYWPTLASNLAECQIPYNDFLDVLRVAGQDAVTAAFGIENEDGENGWLVGCFSTPYMFASMGQKGNAAGWNPIGSAWALLNAYEYYLYTGDMDYLRDELYPSMKSVANFWNEALYWSDSQQRYVSSPSYSPENGPIVAGASYDQQFIWQHFENTIAAAETLGVDQDLIAQWREKQENLDPVIVGDSGQVKEWYEETTFGKAQAGDLAEIDIPQWRVSLGASSGGQEPPHRHLSHLMALYPCNIISKDNPEYMDAAMVTLEERGLDATGWSKAHKLNLWARTGHSEEAFEIVQSAVGGGNSGFLTNLFSSHGGGANYKGYPIFQIDGNFGYTAGVNEMLLQSQLGYVQFLPTLPEEWNTGFVNGMVARDNFEIDMKWTDGVADYFTVTSRNGGEFTAEYPGLSEYTVIDAQGNPVATENLSADKISFQTEQGATYTITSETQTESVSKTTLEYFLNSAKEHLANGDVDDCVQAVKDLFNEAIAEGDAVMADENATREQVINTAFKLMKAIQALNMKAADLTDLEMAVELAEMIDLNDYVSAGQQAFTNALTAAKDVLADGNAMQAEADSAWNALVNAMSALRLKANKDALESLLKEVEGLDLTQYTEESVAVFSNALESAKAVFANADLSVDDQAEIDNAVAALRSAKDGLVAKSETPDPENPDPEKPGGDTGNTGNNGSNSNNGSNNAGSNNSSTANKAAKTGDTAPIAGLMMLVIFSGAAAVVVSKKRAR